MKKKLWENYILNFYGIMESQIFSLIDSLKRKGTKIMEKKLEKIKETFNWIKAGTGSVKNCPL